MPLLLGVARDRTPGECRVPLTLDSAKRFAAAGVSLVLEHDFAAPIHVPDSAFTGAQFVDNAEAVHASAQLVLCITPPSPELLARLSPGAVLAGFLRPYESADRIRVLCERRVTALPLELVPRISRAQSMDALSSQASAAGYEAALIGASLCPKFFPMLTTAAGTIRPARVLVIGAGVAGLQAIATAKRLGAAVEGYDVRSAAREQVESLGAKFVDTGVSADGAGGYARELSDEEKAQQRAKLAAAVARADVVITTAAVPGKRAPVIVDAEMASGMLPGSVVVDLAAEQGGNCALTRPGETVRHGPVTVTGPVKLPSRLPVHASDMLARNLANLLLPFIQDGVFTPDWADDVLAGTVLTRDGQLVHEGVRKVLNWQNP